MIHRQLFLLQQVATTHRPCDHRQNHIVEAGTGVNWRIPLEVRESAHTMPAVGDGAG